MDNVNDGLAADIATYGWSVLTVEADADGPGFAYTIGLHRRFGHAEVILVGLPSRIAHTILNDLGEDVRGGARFAAGGSTRM